jgi:asparagine synthase (glutamine-hydrolysing)
MCGITGWLDWEQDLRQHSAVVERMADTLRRRGPDQSGIWVSERAVLAHRRLIVIDAKSGTQPMIHEADGASVVLSYNGEIYNFTELRDELKQRGHEFRSRSDTEVLLRSYLEWGESCVEHLNGIFAFAIWDERNQRLLLARDRLGVKPLFYAQRKSALLFGSELKALLAHPLVKPVVSNEGLFQALSLCFFHIPGTGFYKDVFEVLPGHVITFDRQGARDRTYWTLRSAPHTDDLQTSAERVRALLEDTVCRQLVADVPVATLLSGGLDSSGVTALAAREQRRKGLPLSSYSIDFVDSARHFVPNGLHLSLDEPYAELLARYAQTDHHRIVVDTPELMEHLLFPLYAYDHCGGMTQLDSSMYLLFKAMKQDATVALSGESADEVFGGYPWFHIPELMQANTFPWVALMQPMWNSENAFPLLTEEARRWMRPGEILRRQYEQALSEVPRLAGEDALSARRREVFYFNITRWLPLLLDRKDRMSMAVGFEVRVPFCDHRLIEYVWNIPWDIKMVDNIEKGILRRALADVLPEEVKNRKKSPYPTTQNPSYRKAIIERVLEILDTSSSPALEIINAQAVRRLLELPASSAIGTFILSPLERLIQLDAWLRNYHVQLE